MLSNISRPSPPLELIATDGEMGKLIRTYDWSKSSLGPISAWPQSLLTTVNIMLASHFPMVLYWGPQLITIYNDAYIAIFGARHPKGLGKPASEAWKEIWEVIAPMFQQVLQTGKATWSNDQLLFMTRNNYLEECYFTWSFSAIRTEDGQIGGTMTPVIETTQRVLSERRVGTLKKLGSETLKLKSIAEACQTTLNVLGKNSTDIPFALIYLSGANQQDLTLMGTHGIPSGSQQAPLTIALTEESTSIWPIVKALKTNTLFEVNDLKALGDFPGGPWPESSHKAVIVPLMFSEAEKPAGALMIGINPRRAFDEDYRGFVELIGTQLSNAISIAKAYEAEHKRAEGLLALDKAKTAFFSNVSHEFRTPLTLMLGPLEGSLKDPLHPLSSEQQERQSLIYRNALRLLKLVNSLLDFSRIEAKRMQAVFEATELSQLTTDLASAFRATIEKAGLQLIVETPSLGEPVYLDKELYEKIIFNLLSNAFKFTFEGLIKVSLKKQATNVEIRVQDTGIGIPNAELSRIFERFYRIESSFGRSYEGSGIGLALLKELVELHKGSIRVESTVNQGTTFILCLPLGSAHLSAQQLDKRTRYQPGIIGSAFIEEAAQWLPTITTPSPQRLRRSLTVPEVPALSFQAPNPSLVPTLAAHTPKILIVDDNADMRQYLKSLLVPFWQVKTVGDGEAALAAVQIELPDLILSDVMMPKIDGFELIKRLHQESKTALIPVILLSARAKEEAGIEGLEGGAVDYLVKPFAAKELLARVKTHLELGQLRTALEEKVKARTQELQSANSLLQQKMVELKAAEVTLAKSEESYRMLAAISPAGIFHCDKEGKATFFNEKAYEISGLTSEQVQKGEWISVLHYEDRERVWTAWQDFISGKVKHFKQEYRFLRANSSITWVIAEAVVEKDEQGAVKGFVATLTDISEVKDLEQKRLKAVQQLEEHQRKRAEEAEKHRKQQEQFIDTMCHELRNPLNGIYGNINLLEGSLSTLEKLLSSLQTEKTNLNWQAEMFEHLREYKESIAAIDSCARHQKVITDDVLNLSKLEAGKLDLNFVDFDPKKALKEVLDMLNIEFKRKNIQLYSNLIYEDVLVNGDPDRLKQIFFNVLLNAIKFTPMDGKISIHLLGSELSQNHTVLNFRIEDNGIGMTEEEKFRIFDRFAQASRTTSQEYGGSGLGLVISKHLIELMGGTITVESEKNQGTKIIFSIRCNNVPKVEKIASPLVFSAGASISKPISNKRILIVEDNLINQRILQRHLEQVGYHCEIANQGQEAVEMWEKVPFDVILMDIEMPVMNGLEATKIIRQKEREKGANLSPVPIIGVSGNIRQEHIEEAKKAGMDDYLTKPYNKVTLLEKIVFYTSNQGTLSSGVSSSSSTQEGLNQGEGSTHKNKEQILSKGSHQPAIDHFSSSNKDRPSKRKHVELLKIDKDQSIESHKNAGSSQSNEESAGDLSTSKKTKSALS